MNVSHRRSPWRWAAAVALIAGLVAGAFALRGSHVDVAPEPPSSSAAPLTLPATTSFLSIAVTCPDSAIAAQLENAIPKSFPFDVRNGERVYGSPSRGPIKVENDVGAKRVVVSTPVGGRVQVEKKIAFINASVGIDISGGISASVGGASGNYVYTQATRKIQQEVSTGTSLTVAMQNSNVFPSMVIQMVAIGEESGALDGMLGKVADFFEAEVDDAVDALSSLMEPMIMVVLGTLIGGMVIAMYLPIFKMGQAV
jgi:hypothetical protein